MGSQKDKKDKKNDAKKKEKEFNKLKADYKASCVKINEIQSKWNHLSEESGTWRLKMSKKEEELKRTKKEHEDLKSDFNHLAYTNKELEGQCRTVNDENYHLKNQLEKAWSDIKDRKNDAKKKLKEITKLKTDYKESCVKVNEVQQTLNSLTEESYKWRTREENTRREMKKQGEMLDDKTEIYNALKAEYELLCDQNQQLENELDKLNEENATWKELNEKAALEIEQEKSIVAEKDEILAKLTEDVSSLQFYNKELDVKIRSVAEDSEKWRTEVETLHCRLTEKEDERRNKEEECVQVKQEFDLMSENCNDLEQKLSIVTVEKQSWQDQYQNSQTAICEKEENLGKAKEQWKFLKAKLTLQSSANTKLQDELKTLTSDVAFYKEEIAEKNTAYLDLD